MKSNLNPSFSRPQSAFFGPLKSEASRIKSVQGFLTSSMARCHDYRHANHITKTIHPSKVSVFLFLTTNLEGRYLIFQFLYNTTSLFPILKVINIRNRSTAGLDLHDKFCRHIWSARHGSRKWTDGCHLLFHLLLFFLLLLLLLLRGEFRAKKIDWVTILLEGDGL